MGAILAVVVAAVTILALMPRNPSPRAPASPAPSSGDAGAPPSPSLADSIGGVVEAAVPVVGTLLGGGTTAATGGAVGGGATATATVTTGTAASSAGLGSAASGALATTAGSAALAGAIGAGSIMLVLVVIVICDAVVKAQQNEKDWQSALNELNVNARALNRIEYEAVAAILRKQGRTFTTRSVRDWRLDRYLSGSKVVFQGWHASASTMVLPGEDFTLWTMVRAFAYEALRHRAMLGRRMSVALGVTNEPDFGLSNAKRFTLYDAQEPGLGGLDNVPSAFGGATVAPRLNVSEAAPPVLQLVGDGRANVAGPLPDATMKAARLVGLVEASRVLRFDPRGQEGDGASYARSVLELWSYGGAPLEGVAQDGEFLVTDARVYGAVWRFSPQAIRQGRA